MIMKQNTAFLTSLENVRSATFKLHGVTTCQRQRQRRRQLLVLLDLIELGFDVQQLRKQGSSLPSVRTPSTERKSLTSLVSEKTTRFGKALRRIELSKPIRMRKP